MTSTNTMSGSWNVCSSHQEPTTEWSTAINAASVSITKSCLIISRRSSVNITRTGATQGRGTVDCSFGQAGWTHGSCYTAAISTGDVTCDAAAYAVCRCNLSVAVSNLGLITEGIFNGSVTYSESVWSQAIYNPCTAGYLICGAVIDSRTGSLSIIRSQN